MMRAGLKDLVSLSKGEGAASTKFSSAVAVRVRPFNTSDFNEEGIASKATIHFSKPLSFGGKPVPTRVKLMNPKSEDEDAPKEDGENPQDAVVEAAPEEETSKKHKKKHKHKHKEEEKKKGEEYPPEVDYEYMNAFWKQAQEEISSEFIPNMTNSFLKGVNCCIISAGGVGSGKSHTMFGKGPYAVPHELRKKNPEKAAEFGMFPRFYDFLFEWMNSSKFDKTHATEISVEVFEVKNEDIVDLQVNPDDSKWYSASTNTNIKHNPDGNFRVPGLQKRVVANLAEMVALHNQCSKNATGEGHVVYLVTLKREVRTDHADYYSHGWAEAAVVSALLLFVFVFVWDEY